MSVSNPRDTFSLRKALEPDEYTAAANGEVIDTQGFEYAAMAATLGNVVDTDFDVILQEGDESDGSDMAEVTKFDALSGAADSADDQVYAFSVRLQARKRYLRLRIDADAEVHASGLAILCGMDRSMDLKDADANWLEV